MKTRLLSRKDIEGFFTMKMCMEAVEKAFADLASGNATMPQRTPIGVAEKHGLALFMPAHIKSLAALGAKVVTVYKDNVSRHSLPTVLGTIILLDEDTGFPIAIMDGGFLTAMRTGAVSGVATKYMARPDSKTALIFGAGVQAFSQVLAVHEARPLAGLMAYSLDSPEMKKAFAEKVTAKTGIAVEMVEDPAAAVGRSDIVILATSASEPVLNGNWLKPGTHINGIGSHAPKMRELDALTVQKSRIVCDLTGACKAEAGDFIIPAERGEWSWDKVAGDLGDVILGKMPGRNSPQDITLFKSVGLAVQDMAAARMVYDEAVKRGIGTEFQF
ncbi:MAG: ornithine cyclodeaminase family protein [Acidobacteria bacterium]|nr:ornithine cyclodeaminase family protein [Acidobacteriota bacterium]